MMKFECFWVLKMKASFTFYPILLFLLVSVEFGTCSVVRGDARAVRIPEHSCHKLIDQSIRCELQNCIKECSKEPSGVGVCKSRVCFCTYYCKDPPK
ncbi:hypothetical protein Pyn_24558 [Prunus yedoensis var. nudiflora]|uniref:Uncharacterized protein n=1 Tax=Prunus yedoensis var. nudiflora TaxID=2094558 RepID=A0A314XUN5_PRUYE|nr:hypothetical protein Pyn_24558 [Prunus yedoensis var. nudiflora]